MVVVAVAVVVVVVVNATNIFQNLRRQKGKSKAVPVTGLEWPRGFQEVKVPRLHDNGTGW
jgi:hypothetical protein